MEYSEISVYILLGCVIGILLSYVGIKLFKNYLKVKDFKSMGDIQSQINRFEGFKSFKIRYALNYYRRIAERWEDRGKTLIGFSGILLALIVPITVEFLLSYWLSMVIAFISAFCFLLASLISSFYLVFPKGALWTKCEDAVDYYYCKSLTLDKMVKIAFLFFISGLVLIFILLLSVVLI